MGSQPPVNLDDIGSAPDDSVRAGGDAAVSIDEYRKALARVGEEKDALQAELEKVQGKVRTIQILDELIEPMASRSFTFMCIYCIVVAEIVLFHGFKLFGFSLPEGVLQFLVGSTATTLLALSEWF